MKEYKDISQLIQLVIGAFNSLEDIVYIIEAEAGNFTYLFANSKGLSILDCDHDLIGRTFEEVLPKEKADLLHHFYSEALNKQMVVTFEDEVTAYDKWLNYETVLTPIEMNNETFIIAIVRDVTERTKKLTELQRTTYLLEENEQRLSSLVDNNDDAVFMFDLEGNFLEVNSSTKRITGYSEMELVGKHFSNLMSSKEYELVKEIIHQTLEGESNHYETYIFHKEGQKIYLSVKNIPLKVEGDIIGICGIAKDITSQKQAYDELYQTKSRLESFVEDSTDAIMITNLNGELDYVNEAYTSIFGFTEEEVLHRPNPIIPDWLKGEAKELYQQARSGKKMQNIHVKRQKKSGKLGDFSITLSPIYDAFGHITGISTICRDITESKQNELEMIKVKEELELVWNFSTDAIFMVGYDGRILQANPTFKDMFLPENEEINSLSLSHIYLEQQTKQLDEILLQLREKESTLSFETKRKRKDGEILDVVATYRPINKGNILAVATYKDVTETKALLQKLKESEERYRRVLEVSPEPTVIHSDRKISYINKAGLDLLKANHVDQVVNKSIMNFIHPRNQDQILERMDNLKNGSNVEKAELQFLTINGEAIDVEVTSAPFRIHGKSSNVAICRDVSHKIRGEKALKESEERFRIIAEHSKDIIKIVNLDGKITYVSHSLEDILGHPVRKVIGKSIFENIHLEDINQALKTFRKVKMLKEEMEVELRHVHQDGHALWLNSHFKPILSPSGELEKILLISTDITEAKQNVEELANMAYYDFLTGLPNRRLFIKELKEAMDTSDQTGTLTSLMVIDCDKFKQINDTFGHDYGDEVIIEFSKRVKETLREHDTLTRIGGDEFAIVLPELKTKKDAINTANNILEVIHQPMNIKGQKIEISSSIGIAFYPESALSVEELFKKADINLYKSKDYGGNVWNS